MDIRIVRFDRRVKGDKTHDWVMLTNRAAYSDNGQLAHATWHKVHKLIPPESHDNDGKVLHMRAVWSVVEPAYEAWKAGNEIPENGTPLASWPGVTADQADLLRAVGLRTVEDVAAFSGEKRPIPNFLDLQRQAKAWVENKGASDMADKIRELEEQNAAMLEMLSERKEAEKVAPKRRGRPPKAESEAA